VLAVFGFGVATFAATREAGWWARELSHVARKQGFGARCGHKGRRSGGREILSGARTRTAALPVAEGKRKVAIPSVQTVSGDGGGALQSHRVRPVKMRRSRRFGEMDEAY